MKLVVGTKEEISKMIADEVINQIKSKLNSVLGLATGSSPIEVYENLVKSNVSFKNVKTFNLDEYLGIDETNCQSYRYFMNSHLFDFIDIDKANINFPSMKIDYDKKIEENGGIDLQILGIGRNGHIAFNEPGTSFDSLTHICDLTEETIKDNSRFFNSIDEVPKQAVTMGLKSIFNARKILLIATGKNKNKAIYNLLKGEINESNPCSILRNHKDCTIYMDYDAFSLILGE